MQNRETILRTIEAQQREWDKQVRNLQSKLLSCNVYQKADLEKCIMHLNSKLYTIEKNTNELKIASDKIWEKHGNDISQCWQELVHNVDYVIANYRKIFNQ